MKTRHACAADIPQILKLVDAARDIMRADGNLGQWADGYPSQELIGEDISLGRGYVLVAPPDNEPIAYFAFMEGPEPTYSKIYAGAWKDDSAPYSVIHRLASAPSSHGIFDAMMAFACSRCLNLRIDTHSDNSIMRHNILRHGFEYCGIIRLASGDERGAYQLLVRGALSTRPATPEDIPLINDLAWNIFPQTYAAMHTVEQNEYMMDWMYSPESLRKQMQEEGHIFRMAYLGSTPVGYVSYREEEKDVYHLQKIYLLPTLQGRGYGKTLFQTAITEIKKLHPSPCQVRLNVNRRNKAVDFYKHMGMREIAHGDFSIGSGYYMIDYIMAIDI